LNLKPVLVVVIGALFGMETLTFKKFLYIVISFLGAALIIDPLWFANLWLYFKRIFWGSETNSFPDVSSDKSNFIFPQYSYLSIL
jgi:drug/metabolite transporter (DMT)-like permease